MQCTALNISVITAVLKAVLTWVNIRIIQIESFKFFQIVTAFLVPMKKKFFKRRPVNRKRHAHRFSGVVLYNRHVKQY
jgi:hypothetical protein